jgi:hypothetical protein
MAKISWVIGSEMLKENEGKRCSKNPAFDYIFMAPRFPTLKSNVASENSISGLEDLRDKFGVSQ